MHPLKNCLYHLDEPVTDKKQKFGWKDYQEKENFVLLIENKNGFCDILKKLPIR